MYLTEIKAHQRKVQSGKQRCANFSSSTKDAMQSPESLGSDGAPGLSPAPHDCTPQATTLHGSALPRCHHVFLSASPSALIPSALCVLSFLLPETPHSLSNCPQIFYTSIASLSLILLSDNGLGAALPLPVTCNCTFVPSSPLSYSCLIILKVYDIWGTGKEIFLTNKRTYIRKKLKYTIPVSCSKHT